MSHKKLRVVKEWHTQYSRTHAAYACSKLFRIRIPIASSRFPAKKFILINYSVKINQNNELTSVSALAFSSNTSRPFSYFLCNMLSHFSRIALWKPEPLRVVFISSSTFSLHRLLNHEETWTLNKRHWSMYSRGCLVKSSQIRLWSVLIDRLQFVRKNLSRALIAVKQRPFRDFNRSRCFYNRFMKHASDGTRNDCDCVWSCPKVLRSRYRVPELAN